MAAKAEGVCLQCSRLKQQEYLSLNTNTLLTLAALCFPQVLADQMFSPHLCQEMPRDRTQHCDVVHLQNYPQNALRHLAAKMTNINKRYREFNKQPRM